LNSHLLTKKFLFKNSDIIFENELIQIGVKGETIKNSMNIELYYGNKTNFHLSNFSVNIFTFGGLESG
jgi:AP-2 complex subunit alpha